MRKIVLSLGTAVFVGALAISATGAFFSDTETSTGNTFTSGAIDLTIDSVSHYNGMVCTSVGEDTYVWIPEANVTLDGDNQPVAGENMNEQAEWDAFNTANPAQFPEAGTPCTGTWPLADLGEGEGFAVGTFFDFDDIKPGDEGENTISIHIDSNDAWMCAELSNIAGADPLETATEPEDTEEDLLGDITHASTTEASELDENLNFFAWLDDGDNLFEEGEIDFGDPVSASSLSAQTWALADGGTGNGPIEGGETQYIGVAWCAGEMTVVGNTITCDGEGMGNEAQTDSWSADLSFYVEQSRNNPDFRCEGDEPEPVVTTLTLAKTVIPALQFPDSDFTLTASSTNTLTLISGIEGSGSVTNASVTPGVYALSESSSHPGADVTWQCIGNATPEVDNGDGTATVTIAAGESVGCDVSNDFTPNQ
jgi:predicted ribosomally synthesized peptide with SipW-like signal peptide